MIDQKLPGGGRLKEAAEARQFAPKQTPAEWMKENKEAIESHNAWVEKHGLALSKYRQF